VVVGARVTGCGRRSGPVPAPFPGTGELEDRDPGQEQGLDSPDEAPTGGCGLLVELHYGGLSGAQLPGCPAGHPGGREGELALLPTEGEGSRQHHVGPLGPVKNRPQGIADTGTELVSSRRAGSVSSSPRHWFGACGWLQVLP
jgi:hypothetical protein